MPILNASIFHTFCILYINIFIYLYIYIYVCAYAQTREKISVNEFYNVLEHVSRLYQKLIIIDYLTNINLS